MLQEKVKCEILAEDVFLEINIARCFRPDPWIWIRSETMRYATLRMFSMSSGNSLLLLLKQARHKKYSLAAVQRVLPSPRLSLQA